MRPRVPPPVVIAALQYAGRGASVAGYLLGHPEIDWSLYLSPEQLAQAEREAEEHKKTWIELRKGLTQKAS